MRAILVVVRAILLGGARTAVILACAQTVLLGAAWLAPIGLTGCAQQEARGRAARELEQLERLAFVPPANCRRPTRRDSLLVDCSHERPLLVARFEVTRSEWEEWRASLPPGRAVPPSPEAAGGEGNGTRLEARLPASYMTFHEAAEYAAWRGMRLPTAREWFRIASGTRGRRWPWGDFAKASAANTLELGLEGPSPVGAFELGRSPLGVYDLIGNVAEWVAGEWETRDPQTDPRPGVEPASIVDGGDELTWALGGSSLTRARWLIVANDRENAQLLHRDHRAIDVGLRLVVDARTHLSRAATRLAVGALPERRLLAIGRTWGRDAAAWLARLAEETTAPGERAVLAALAKGAQEGP